MSIEKASAGQHLAIGIRAGIAMMTLCGIVYTFAVTGLGGALFPHQATGSLITKGDQVVGSALVGQQFASDSYFYGRPSAVNHDPFSTGGSNLAPSNPDLRDRVKQDSAHIAERENVSADQIPVDLLATSGGGIDPHISPEAARLQLARVAAARNIEQAQLEQLISQHTEQPQLGLFGQPRINVLQLNIALDQLTSEK